MSKETGHNQDMTEVWHEYKLHKSPAIREQLVEHYIGLVNIIAGRIAINLPSHVEKEELVSCGFFGLLDAVERYDPDMGNKFETYAGIRIRGAILDSLREKDWLPASVRQKIKRYEQTITELEGKLGRPAKDSEIAAHMGCTEHDLNMLVTQMNLATTVPLEDYMRSEKVQASSDDVSRNIEAEEVRNCLASAIDKLPEKEKLVVSLYYYEEMTLKEISLIMHLTEARISQLHTKAVFRMRGALARIKSSLV